MIRYKLKLKKVYEYDVKIIIIVIKEIFFKDRIISDN